MGFEHLDLAILCLLMLKIIRVSSSHQPIQTAGLLCLCQIPAAFLCGKILNFFRTLLAGSVQAFPHGCLPCDTFHITGALKGHQSLWNGGPGAKQQSDKLRGKHRCGGARQGGTISSQAANDLKCHHEISQVFKGNFQCHHLKLY